MEIKKISEISGLRVYTDSGNFVGEVVEANLADNKIDGWKIRAAGGVVSLIGGAKGLIVPHQFVRAIGDVFVVDKNSLPSGMHFSEVAREEDF